MNGIILCEGNTDQILLSKYFGSKYSFVYESERHDRFMHRCRYRNKNGELLSIAHVGGKNQFVKALEYVLKINKLNDSNTVIDYIAVVMDHDSDDEVMSMQRGLEQVLHLHCTKKQDSLPDWSEWKQCAEFGETKTLQFIFISIPMQGNGALETFLLNALQDDEDNRYLVEQSNSFVSHLIHKKQSGTVSFPYEVLQSRRLQIKAPLAVYFGVVNPERIFAKFEDVLGSIAWARYESINSGFRAFQSVMISDER